MNTALLNHILIREPETLSLLELIFNPTFIQLLLMIWSPIIIFILIKTIVNKFMESELPTREEM